MSKAKVAVDRFYAKGAVLQAASSKLAFAAAIAMVASSAYAPPSKGADNAGANAAYSSFIADLQERLNAEMGAGRVVVLDRSKTSFEQQKHLWDLGVEGVESYRRPTTQIGETDAGPVCVVAGPAPSMTAARAFDLKSGEVVQAGSITDLDVQKWGTYAQLGQCFDFGSPRQGAVFAAYMTHLDGTVSADLLPVMIAFNELNEWSGAHSSTNNYVASSLRRAAKVLDDERFRGDLPQASVLDVAEFSNKTYTNEPTSRADTFRRALEAASAEVGYQIIADAGWLDRARVIPELEQIRDLRAYLLGDPAERVLPAEFEMKEAATKVFTAVLAEQGDLVAQHITASFSYDQPVAAHSLVVSHEMSAFAVDVPEAGEPEASGPRM